jgi:hypothetical protein
MREVPGSNYFRDKDIIIIIIGFTDLAGLWPPQANVASDLYTGHPPANFYNPVSLRHSLTRQSIKISVGHVTLTSRVGKRMWYLAM